MNKKPITHVLHVVDMSGSMHGLASDVRGGFNTHLDDLAKSDGRYRITATVFDTRFISLCVAAKLKDTPRLTDVNYAPAGMTALLDAIGKTVAEFEAKTALAEGERVLVVVQTDGHENSSREFTYERIAEMIRTREAGGKWTFMYLGAGVEAWDQAQRMGFLTTNSVNTANTAAGTRSRYSGVTRGTVSYAAGATGQSVAAEVAAVAAVDLDKTEQKTENTT